MSEEKNGNFFTITPNGEIVCSTLYVCRERNSGASHCQAIGAPLTDGDSVNRFTPGNCTRYYPCGRPIDPNPQEDH